jgi:ABC-type enterochelin transport system permease subunit
VRIVRFLLRLVGWLLTPLVAWAASFCGAWLGALFVPLADRPTTGLILAIALGAVFAVTGTVLWMRILRKSPELREVLAVTAEGIPVVAIEAEQPEDARHPVSM